MAPQSVGTLFFVEAQAYKAQKALVAAKFNGLQLDTKTFNIQTDARKPDFLAKNPAGKVPYLETERGCLFTSTAIARYIAKCRSDTDLFGRSFDDESLIDTWLEFATHELEIPLMQWVYPVLGLIEAPNATVLEEAKGDVKIALGLLEQQLGKTKFLVGEYLTLADIAVVCTIREAMTLVIEPSVRKPFPKFCAWFESCCNMPQFEAVFGKVVLCKTAEKPQPVRKEFLPPARKEDKKGAEPKAAAQPKKAAKDEKAPAPKAAAAPTPAAGGANDAKIKEVGDAIRDLKAKLKAEGLSGKKIDAHPDVAAKVKELQELKAAPAAAPAAAAPAAAAPAAASAGGGNDAKIKEVGDAIRELKAKLKAEGLSGKKIDAHPDVAAKVKELQELKAAPAAAPVAAPAAPAAAGGSNDAKIKEVGDAIRELKAKLKAEGLSGKKIDAHPDVAAKVKELQELKASN